MWDGLMANGWALTLYLLMDVLAFVLLLGALMWVSYRGDPDPLDNTHPHPTQAPHRS
jgi:hypothetical protein